VVLTGATVELDGDGEVVNEEGAEVVLGGTELEPEATEATLVADTTAVCDTLPAPE
jgi:hypothetical protein